MTKLREAIPPGHETFNGISYDLRAFSRCPVCPSFDRKPTFYQIEDKIEDGTKILLPSFIDMLYYLINEKFLGKYNLLFDSLWNNYLLLIVYRDSDIQTEYQNRNKRRTLGIVCAQMNTCEWPNVRVNMRGYKHAEVKYSYIHISFNLI